MPHPVLFSYETNEQVCPPCLLITSCSLNRYYRVYPFIRDLRYLVTSKLKRRFRQILWPSQNVQSDNFRRHFWGSIFELWNFLWNFTTFHSFLVIKQTISFIISELNLPKLAKIMGCKLVRLSQPILLDLCLHPSINAFWQDGCRYLLSIFKCSIAQKHSKFSFYCFLLGFFLPCREQDLLTFHLWRSSFEQ